MVNCKLLTVDDDLNLKYQLKFLEIGGRGKENPLSLSFFPTFIVVSILEVPVKSLWDGLLS